MSFKDFSLNFFAIWKTFNQNDKNIRSDRMEPVERKKESESLSEDFSLYGSDGVLGQNLPVPVKLYPLLLSHGMASIQDGEIVTTTHKLTSSHHLHA